MAYLSPYFITNAEKMVAELCIGCGRVAASRPCVGICQDRRTRSVELENFVAALERAENSEARASSLASFARLIAMTHAKPGGAEATPNALQTRARAVLASVAVPHS
jgi:hypothetical protein